MKRMILASAAVLMMTCGVARAGLCTWSVDIWDVRDESNQPLVGSWAMLIDRNNNLSSGFGGYSTSNAWLWDSGDLLLGRGEISNNTSAAGWLSASVAGIDNTLASATDHVYVMWFNKPYDPVATGPGSGVHYGYQDAGEFVGTEGYNFSIDFAAGTSPHVTAGTTNKWNNAASSRDVDGDGLVTPRDALLIINKLAALGGGSHALAEPGDPVFGSGGYYWDVTDDATPTISTADGQQIIDAINSVVGAGMGPLAADIASFAVGDDSPASGSLWAMSFASAQDWAPSDVQSAPEPATLLLLVAGLPFLRRRRRVA